MRYIDRLISRGRKRIKRAKTFSSEDAAKKYAGAQGLKSFDVVNLKVDPKATPKFKIVAKD